MTFLTILNTLGLIYLFFYKASRHYITCTKIKTHIRNTVVGYNITLWEKTSEFTSSGVWSFDIPIKNIKKVEREEEIDRLINTYSQQNRTQSLHAKFSWLKTWEEVRQFEKDYMAVDSAVVQRLVANFIPKNI